MILIDDINVELNLQIAFTVASFSGSIFLIPTPQKSCIYNNHQIKCKINSLIIKINPRNSVKKASIHKN